MSASSNCLWTPNCFFHIFWSLSVLLSVKCYYPLGLQVIAVIRCASVCWPDTFYRLGPLWVKVKMGYSSRSSSEVQYLLEGNLVVREDECGPVVLPPIPPSSLSLSEGLLRFLCGWLGSCPPEAGCGDLSNAVFMCVFVCGLRPTSLSLCPVRTVVAGPV